MVAHFTPPRLRGLGYGLYFFMTFGAGSLGATLAGWVSERADLARAFPALAVVVIPAVLAMGLLALSGFARAQGRLSGASAVRPGPGF
jgi:hypothetical protein